MENPKDITNHLGHRQVIDLHRQGVGPRRIAADTGVPYTTVRNWTRLDDLETLRGANRRLGEQVNDLTLRLRSLEKERASQDELLSRTQSEANGHWRAEAQRLRDGIEALGRTRAALEERIESLKQDLGATEKRFRLTLKATKRLLVEQNHIATGHLRDLQRARKSLRQVRDQTVSLVLLGLVLGAVIGGFIFVVIHDFAL